MAFSHGLGAKVYYHRLDFTSYVDEVDPSFERELAEYAPLSASWKSSLPGMRSFTVSLSGIFDGTANANAAVAWALFDGGTERVIAYLPQGDAASGIAYCGLTQFGDESAPANTSDVIRMPVSVVGSRIANRCEILHPLDAESADSSTAAFDGGASAEEDLGCEVYLICTALTATDLLDVELEDSDDDGNTDPYATVVAFTQLAAVGSERKAVAAATGVVKRYVRVTWVLTDNSGTPAATFFVAWHRKTS